jgi:ADP-ribosylglycohydrolase
MKITLDRARYRDQVYACWLGKNVGGTLGAPYECRKYVNNLEFFSPVPKEPAPNDDLDIQLVWLQMLEEKGLPPRLPWFAEYWSRHLTAYPWNEYGFCARNLERGLMPPVSGWFENYYVDEEGSPIRSEIWACVAPADPEQAAALAWMDSAMDHAGGEGTNGEMFMAAMESAAFVLSDPEELIELGLSMIPPSCSIARVVREAVWCHGQGKPWAEARERIVKTFGHDQPCNAIPNHGFIILGWLYGRDFGDRLCKAVNCGFDTDCTGATLGSLLGILGGTAAIPAKWSDPVGKTIALHKFTRTTKAPKTLQEAADRTAALAEKFAARAESPIEFGSKTEVPEGARPGLFRTAKARRVLLEDLRAAWVADRDLDIGLHLNGNPVFRPGEVRTIEVAFRRDGVDVPGEPTMQGPPGWTISGQGPAFTVKAGATVKSTKLRVTAEVTGRSYQGEFTVLGPDEAKGYPAAANVEYCPVCHGRKGSCLCQT